MITGISNFKCWLFVRNCIQSLKVPDYDHACSLSVHTMFDDSDLVSVP